jgi:hypothetical protein
LPISETKSWSALGPVTHGCSTTLSSNAAHKCPLWIGYSDRGLAIW